MKTDLALITWEEEERSAWKPPEKLTTSEWADRCRVLVPQTSSEPGPWKTSRTPYLKELMDAFSNPYIEKIVFEAGTQLGKTELEYNCLGYAIDQDPSPTLFTMPTINLARYTSRNRIQPMIEASERLRAKKPADSDRFTLLEMVFPGMVLSLDGANSPASLSARPCRYFFGDEINKYSKFASSEEAGPISLATERQKTFWNKKTVLVSSPSIEDGPITLERKACDYQFKYNLPCPECGSYQALEFSNIHFPENLDNDSPTYAQEVRESAWYQCPACNGIIDDYRKPQMLRDGIWESEDGRMILRDGIVVYKDKKMPPLRQARSIGAHLSSLYSPWLTWGDVAEKWIKAEGDPEKEQNFYNSWLAEPYIPKLFRADEKEILAHRTPYPPLIVPHEALVLTAGVDVQKAGIYYLVRAWARNYTSWLIRYGYILSWDDLYQIIFDDLYPVENSERQMRIWRAAVDTGGSEGSDEEMTSTEEVYTWLRDNGQGVAFGVKGASTTMATRLRQTVIDKMPASKKRKRRRTIPGGLILWLIDTAKFKDVIHYRLQIEPGQAQSFYLHSETGMDYARHITAEEKRRDRNGNVFWHKLRNRNDWLDCEVYCAATVDPEWLGGLRVLPDPDQALPPSRQHRPKVVRSKFMTRGR